MAKRHINFVCDDARDESTDSARASNKAKRRNFVSAAQKDNDVDVDTDVDYLELRDESETKPSGEAHDAVPLNYPSNPDYEMEVYTLNGSNVKKAVEVISTALSTATLRFSASGMQLSGFDSARVSCVLLNLKASSFHTFYCLKTYMFNVDVNSLHKTLAPASSAGRLRFVVKANADETLIVIIPDKNIEYTSRIQNHEITSEYKQQDYQNRVNSMKFSASVRMSAMHFHSVIRQLNQHGLMVKIATDFVSLYLIVHGKNEGKNDSVARIDPDTNDKDKDKDKSGKKSRSMLEFLHSSTELSNVTELYALRYLAIFAKAAGLSNSVRISFAPRKPIVLSYDIGDEGTLNYILVSAHEDAEEETNE